MAHIRRGETGDEMKARFASLPKVTIGSEDADSGASGAIIDPSDEDRILAEVEREAEEHAQKLEAERIARLEADQKVAAPLPPLPTPPVGSPVDAYTAALLLIAEGMRQQNETLKQFIVRQDDDKPIRYHQLVPTTPWNPEGKKKRLQLTRPTFLSGYPVQPIMCTEDEIAALNKLKPGRYHGRQWEVIRYDDGSINVLYPNRTIEARMMMAAEAPTITRLCEIIIAEHEKRVAKRGYADEDEEGAGA
jgi:hypothetical protein